MARAARHARSATRGLVAAWLAADVLRAAGADGGAPLPRARRAARRRGDGRPPPPPVYGRRAQLGTTNSFDDPSSRPSAAPTSALDAIVAGAKRGEDGNTRLRHDLIKRHDGDFDKYNYDKNSYPWDYVWYNDTAGQRTGVPIETEINFHKVSSVNIVASTMDLSVWFRLSWVDPRLTWDPAEYDGLTQTWFWIGDGGPGGETSEIWAPDVELWNLEVGLSESLDDAYAAVSHEGLVFWSRPGHLRPVCKFTGLEMFPFDTLTCALEIGSWTMSGRYIQMERKDGVGWTQDDSVTGGESFSEFVLADADPIAVTRHVYAYDTAPEDDWPVLIYTVAVTRSWAPYARGYILTQVVLNFVGFAVFWLPPSCGERMSLSITAMLAALASEIVVAENLPAAAEWTWFAIFSLLSLLFAFLSLLECVLVLALYYKCDDELGPAWYAFTREWYLVRQAKRHKEKMRDIVITTSDVVAETTSNGVSALHTAARGRRTRREEDSKGGSLDHDSDDWGADAASVLSRDRDPPPPPTRVARDAHDFQDEEEMENNMKWKLVAAKVDNFSRHWIPASYVVALAVIFSRVL